MYVLWSFRLDLSSIITSAWSVCSRHKWALSLSRGQSTGRRARDGNAIPPPNNNHNNHNHNHNHNNRNHNRGAAKGLPPPPMIKAKRGIYSLYEQRKIEKEKKDVKRVR